MTITIERRVRNGDLCAICREPLPERVLVQTSRSGLETLSHVECFEEQKKETPHARMAQS